jgi:two-component system sensor histidine kinase KdpD
MKTITDRLARHGYVLAVAAVALSTLLFLPGRDIFAKGQWAILYLLVVVLVAGVSGTGPAILAAVLAFVCWNFFLLPPYHTLRIHQDEDLLSLVAFLIVGVVMGLQTGRLREREERAVAREREAATINRLSTYLVSEVSTSTVVDTLLEETVRLVPATHAYLFLPQTDERLSLGGSAPQGAPAPSAEVEQAAMWAFSHNEALGLHAAHHSRARAGDGGEATPAGGRSTDDGVCVPLQTAGVARGVLYVNPAQEAADQPEPFSGLLVSLANLVAAFLERQRLQGEVMRAEAGREADVLKASLLSSVSHELRTPLAALTATVSNLLSTDTQWDEATTRAELEAIVADVTRLNNGVGSLLDLSRLESGAWDPRKEEYDLDELVDEALARLPAAGVQRVRLSLPHDLPPVLVDYGQWSRLTLNLVENALLYSPPGGEVRVGAARAGGTMVLWVEDDGPGIRLEEREHVFEKFYRGTQTGQRVPTGTGLGLAIAREIVTAHGGSISVGAAASGGARFEVVLPDEGGRGDGRE